MLLKQKIYSHCLDLLNKKILGLQNVLKELESSNASDTKSSAGDKHETARAMLHIEQENIGKQLKELQEQKAVLERIDPRTHAAQITKGSLVRTDKGFLYLSIALGKIVVEGETLMVISPGSPLGEKLMGLKEKDSVAFNDSHYRVESIE